MAPSPALVSGLLLSTVFVFFIHFRLRALQIIVAKINHSTIKKPLSATNYNIPIISAPVKHPKYCLSNSHCEKDKCFTLRGFMDFRKPVGLIVCRGQATKQQSADA